MTRRSTARRRSRNLGRKRSAQSERTRRYFDADYMKSLPALHDDLWERREGGWDICPCCQYLWAPVEEEEWRKEVDEYLSR